MFPSAPALARSDMTGLGVVTSCRVPVRVALSAPVAWISTSALNYLICWVCCAASDSAEEYRIVLAFYSRAILTNPKRLLRIARNFWSGREDSKFDSFLQILKERFFTRRAAKV